VVAVIMLADEDDCSVRDTDIGWFSIDQSRGITRASSACDANPNDACCYSCVADAPAGCAPKAEDPACAAGEAAALITVQEEVDRLHPNLRCFDQRRKYGFEYLYPVQRYVLGLTSPWLPEGFDERGEPLKDEMGEVRFLQNPLFSEPLDDQGNIRSKEQVFFVGIVGVPWQDLATIASLDEAQPLEYLSHEELTAQARWPLVLGAPGSPTTAPTPPGDKLMFETTADRTTLFGPATHPLLGAPGALAPSSAAGFPNMINGHESNIADKSELQYACVFPLPVAKDCAAGAAACDCKPQDAAFNRAVCNGTTQTHAKAYPGIRELRVLKDFGDRTGNAITTSICPKTLSNSDSPGYGYNPAFSALVESLKPVLMR